MRGFLTFKRISAIISCGKMRKISLLLLALVFLGNLFPQQIQEESTVINIEVPVRVFTGDDFVDSLTIDDFEVYEDGVLQKIEAVYLVKKRSIERSEEKKRFAPDTARNFYLFFEISKYTPKLGDAVKYFINNVIYPGDYLNIITPLKTYRLKGKSLELKSREEIIDNLIGIVRKDALMGNAEYRSNVETLTALAASMSAQFDPEADMLTDVASAEEQFDVTIEERLTRYQSVLGNLENMREISQKKLLDFADYLQELEGQKYVFLFYEREYIPSIDPKILYAFLTLYQDRPTIQHTIANLFEFYNRDISFNIDLVKQAYADASIAIHFLFISQPREKVYGVYFQEQSEDIFAAFREMATATGGFISSSANPDALFRKAVESSENYYLIYYSPRVYLRDGKFKNIDVKLKDKKYRIIHRVGYFAD